MHNSEYPDRIITYKCRDTKSYLGNIWYAYVNNKKYDKDTFIYKNGYGNEGENFTLTGYVISLHDEDYFPENNKPENNLDGFATLNEAKVKLADLIAEKEKWIE